MYVDRKLLIVTNIEHILEKECLFPPQYVEQMLDRFFHNQVYSISHGDHLAKG